jgi:hypothetical protein
MSSKLEEFHRLSSHLNDLLDTNPAEAVKQAGDIDSDAEKFFMSLKAAILIDGGALTGQPQAIEAGIELLRVLRKQHPSADVTYNLANGLIALAGFPPAGPNWVDHQERTKAIRAEARRFFWEVANDADVAPSIRTQAYTNLANQFSNSMRLGEAHDAWLAALQIDPENGVAAAAAARNLKWLYDQGGCSELTHIEAAMLAKIAQKNLDRIREYAGAQAAEHINNLAGAFDEPPPRTLNKDPFLHWVEQERLTLAPAVELVDPTLAKLDWLMLPGIVDRGPDAGLKPPPVFAMFNVLKSDFILSRDLAWRAIDGSAAWPGTGRYGDTLDFAVYGPDASALVLAHRTALDLLDKVAVTANQYFRLGQPPDKLSFGRLWRDKKDKDKLNEKAEVVMRSPVHSLYGLLELADDYEISGGILYSQKALRNAGTHRFVVLHILGTLSHCRQSPEIEHQLKEPFTQEVLRALRVARSAIQMLALAITQNERQLAKHRTGPIAPLIVPDFDGNIQNDE